ncbi:ATP-binding protein [Pseudobacteriovorax antillogorgiicola]|nr:ATP-binding protein [Pseudobacteriovorax antillogorgiicola]
MHRIIGGIIMLTLGVHFLSWFLSQSSLQGVTLVQEPLHAAVEVAGSLIALAVGLALLSRWGEIFSDSGNTKPVAWAMIAMGVIDGMHGVISPGNNFVFLHSLASFVGGLFFLSVFFPKLIDPIPPKPGLAILGVVLSAIFLCTQTWPELIPRMLTDSGHFSSNAIFLNWGGGLGLALAGGKLLRDYYRQRCIHDLLFSLHCLSFAAAAMMFEASKLWDVSWWAWHILRLFAYGIALAVLLHEKVESDQSSWQSLSRTIAKQSKKLGRVADNLNLTLEAANIGIWEFDPIQLSLRGDERFRALTEQDQGDSLISFTRLKSSIHPDDYASLKKKLLSVESIVDIELDVRVGNEHEFVRYLRLKGKVRRHEERSVILGVCWEITDIKTHEHRLVQARLEAEKAKSAAEQASRAKSMFLSNMSHEIRTPLNGVMGLSEEILEETPKDHPHYQAIHSIVASGQSLLSIINDILDYSKLEAGKVELEPAPVDMRDLLENLINLFSSTASRNSVSLSYSLDMNTAEYPVCDRYRLQQVLNNLISNAIKFSPGGSVRVEAKLIVANDETHGGKDRVLEIIIEDSGIGINEENLQKLFTPFSQADMSTTRRFGGTGLGLSICSSLVQLMGGKIDVETEIGFGSTFKVSLPVSIAQLRPMRQKAKMDLELLDSDLKILVAEDNNVNQMVIEMSLKSLGFSPTIVENGQLACAAESRSNFDVIFMDCHMPVMDGFEATAEILKDRKGRHTPLVCALTASVMKDDIDRCHQCGMERVLSKPVRKHDLYEVLLQASHIRGHSDKLKASA